MRFLTVILILVSISCAQNTYLLNDQGDTFKMCNVPDMYFVSMNGLPKKYETAITNAFNHWNDVLGKKIFVDSDRSICIKATVINIRQDYFDSHYAPFGNDYCVKNNMRFLKSGCLIGTDIIIKKECMNDPDMVETLVRRAAGNILGLANQVKPGTLMDFRVQLEAQHPVDANDEEIDAIRKLYSN